MVQEKICFPLVITDADVDVDQLLYLYLELEYLCLEKRITNSVF